MIQVFGDIVTPGSNAKRCRLGIGSLFLYNFAFIVPLLAVLGIILFGIRHEKIAAFFKERLGAAKIAMAVLFAALAALVWVF